MHMQFLNLPLNLCTEIWDALRAAAEADVSLAQAIVESAGVIVSNADLTLCYDERGLIFHLIHCFSYHSFNCARVFY